ncbi:MAG: B12-binding domain-containing radical SAM protein [Candidatus Altiarchaeales archaeon]|nr:MAG: B12-binding domain-containing radical SAM protein [Candidatus Altiarchaeales archaeon]
MRIYLLNPPYFPHFGREMRWQDTGRGGTLYYPIWLSYATGVLENKGHDVRLVDAPAWDWGIEKVMEDLRKFSPDMVVVGTSFTSVNNDLDVSKKIKNELDADVPVIMVGPPTSQFPEKMLNGSVDIVARYEYDFTLAELAERMERNGRIGDISGISFKQNGKVIHNPNRPWSTSGELDGLPFVSEVYKRHLNIRDYFLNYSLYPMVQVFTGRGCPHRCTFCSWPQSFMGRKYRVRRVENILNELEWIEANLPEVKEVFFEDDTLTIDKRRVLEFCKGYRETGLEITWSCNARADTLDLETMREMKRANCRFLIVGFESGDDEILKKIKKGFTTGQTEEFARNVKKAGLLLHADFIIGLPGETKETIEKTRRFIKEIKPEQVQVSVSSPFPGTELYEWCRENGYLLTDDPNEYLDEEGHQKAIISYPNLSSEEMVKEVDKMLKDYYMSLGYVPLAVRQVLRRHSLDEMKRLWHSARMFMGYIGGRGE